MHDITSVQKAHAGRMSLGNSSDVLSENQIEISEAKYLIANI
jgi:hypothetical protein